MTVAKLASKDDGLQRYVEAMRAFNKSSLPSKIILLRYILYFTNKYLNSLLLLCYKHALINISPKGVIYIFFFFNVTVPISSEICIFIEKYIGFVSNSSYNV